MSNFFNIFIIIFFISIFIYVVKNNKEIIEKLEDLKLKKSFKILTIISFCVFILVYVIYFGKSLYVLKESIDYAIIFNNSQKFFLEEDKKIQKENSFYKEYMEKNYQDKFNMPYILDGFEHVRWRMEYWVYNTR